MPIPKEVYFHAMPGTRDIDHRSLEVIEPLKCISNEGQTHFIIFFDLLVTLSSSSSLGSFEMGGGVSLVDLVDRKVLRINVRA